MDEHTYIVVYREGHWWIIHDHHRDGPFSSEGIARRVAVSKARQAGNEGEVWEDVPGDGMPKLYP